MQIDPDSSIGFFIALGATVVLSALAGTAGYLRGYDNGERFGERTEVVKVYETEVLPSEERKQLQDRIAALSGGVDALLACGEAFGVDPSEVAEHYREQLREDFEAEAGLDAEMDDGRGQGRYEY